jgi:hypothetical protein
VAEGHPLHPEYRRHWLIPPGYLLVPWPLLEHRGQVRNQPGRLPLVILRMLLPKPPGQSSEVAYCLLDEILLFLPVYTVRNHIPEIPRYIFINEI